MTTPQGVDAGTEAGRPIISFVDPATGQVLRRVRAARVGFDEQPEELPLTDDPTPLPES